MSKYCFALDLKNDPDLIAAYEAHHVAVWPEIRASIKDAGIEHMEIFRWQNRLFMIMETNAAFSLERKAAMDAANPRVQEWEELMGKFQQALPGAKTGEKWVQLNKIFDL